MLSIIPLSWGFSSPICSDVQLSYQNSNCCNNPSATASCFVQATELESTVQYMDAKLKAMEVPSKIYKMIDLSMTYLANKNDRSHPDSVYYTIDIKDETAYLAEAYKLVRDLSAPDIEYHVYMNGQAGKELSGISYDFRTLLSSSFTGTEISLLTTMAFSSSGVQATWPALVRVYYWYAWFWVVANGRDVFHHKTGGSYIISDDIIGRGEVIVETDIVASHMSSSIGFPVWGVAAPSNASEIATGDGRLTLSLSQSSEGWKLKKVVLYLVQFKDTL